jgi:hypothetical protein
MLVLSSRKRGLSSPREVAAAAVHELFEDLCGASITFGEGTNAQSIDTAVFQARRYQWG